MPSMKQWNNYGGLHVTSNVTAEPTVDATPRKIVAWGATCPSGDRASSSTSTNDVTITDAGDYNISAQLSFSASLSKTFEVEVYIDGSPTGYKAIRKMGTGGDIGSVSIEGLHTLSANAVISLYQSSIDGGSVMTIKDAQLTVSREG